MVTLSVSGKEYWLQTQIKCKLGHAELHKPAPGFGEGDTVSIQLKSHAVFRAFIGRNFLILKFIINVISVKILYFQELVAGSPDEKNWKVGYSLITFITMKLQCMYSYETSTTTFIGTIFTYLFTLQDIWMVLEYYRASQK
jgi:hypothetical protein